MENKGKVHILSLAQKEERKENLLKIMSENKKYYIVGNSECYIVGNREGCPWDQSHLRRWTDHWDGRPRHVLR